MLYSVMLLVVRFAKAMLTPFETAFQPICDGIKERADRLDRVVNAATLDGKCGGYIFLLDWR